MKTRMISNDFYVAIQGVMTEAHESGWSIDEVEQTAIEAAEEWIEEMEKEFLGEEK